MNIIEMIVRGLEDVYVLMLNGERAVCIGDVDGVREICVSEKRKNPKNRYRVLRVPGENKSEKAVILDYILNNEHGQLDILMKTGAELRDEVEVLQGLGFGVEPIKHDNDEYLY